MRKIPVRDFCRSFKAKVDLSDEQYVENEKERYVPRNVNPFREPHTGLDDRDSKEEGSEGPPEWSELAGDLAWTSTFSSLTSNTAITEYSAVWNYAVFFGLTWHLWATQTTYDIRYYTNDWWHRIFFALQIGVYALLAAFSGSFNIGWKLAPSSWTELFTDNSTPLTAQAMKDNQEYLITKSFRGINMMLFISRMLLAVQYARVTWYRKRSKQPWSWRFWLTPIAVGVSGLIFLGCFFWIKEEPHSKPAAIGQVTLWAVAVALQFVAAVSTPNDRKGALKSDGAMSSRLSSLTVIILGEGLNGICGTLSHSMNSLGLSPTMVGQSLAILLILYFIWLLYFDGFKTKSSPSKLREEIWLYLHFPLHLSLILLLEGIKNVYIYVNVTESFNRLLKAFHEVTAEYGANGEFPEHPRLEKLLRVLDMSWQEEKGNLLDAINKDNADPSGAGINVDSQIWRWWGDVVQKVIQLYYDDKDPEGEDKFKKFTESTPAAIAADYNDVNSPLLYGFSDVYFEKMAYTAHWIVAVGGTLIFSMAIINTVQRLPKNRMAWCYSYIRILLGAALIFIGGATSKRTDEAWIYWILPTITIGYCVGVVVDWFVLRVSVHSIRKLEALSTHLPYGRGPRRSESSPTGTDAQGPKGSSGLLYAPGGETEKSHGEKSISSSL